ncbi:probable pectinesterase/pectinesterase inhibitor 12 [Musa acuminata AAA Group]|uniref:probable pectinesterase/pectinesterase inhibitor 12 n=1 Tax=Musa acuminata AAA Group TaxID=214697 RepID=UPI0031DA34BF
MASSLTWSLFLASLLFLFTLPSPTLSSDVVSSSGNTNAESSVRDLCRSTPYPAACLDSLKLSVSITINPSVLSLALRTLQAAISEAAKLSSVLSSAGRPGAVVESQRSSLQDCQELHQITVASLRRSAGLVKPEARKLADARAYLAAALTNRATCLDGLAGARGPLKATLVDSWLAAYAHVSNSLSLVARSGGRKGRRLSSARSFRSRGCGGFPAWVGRRERRLLQDGDYGDVDPDSVVTVAADGTGNFTTLGEAVAWAPSNSDDRTIILVRAGVYEEHVDIPSDKTNIVLIGDGSDVTVIRGNRSVGDGWTTFRSATVAVSGEGFLARDITFQNVAGPRKGQAVALRVNADLVALYRCVMDGYQDTLYVHSFRQFYRECDVYGTVDFIFGNAAVVLQAGKIVAKMPIPGQSNMITAQSKDDPNEDTGISIQNCTIVASQELASSNVIVKTFLGRPWKNYSTTVYMESYMGGLVDPAGWKEWSGDQGLDTLYYGEYMNSGPGSPTDNRVTWPGFLVMDYDDAYSFTVSEFIYGDEWLESTSFPYDDGI